MANLTAEVHSPFNKLHLRAQAYIEARIAHFRQLRDSGEPYIEHPKALVRMAFAKAHEVSRKLGVQVRNSREDIAILLLHDVVEDSKPKDGETMQQMQQRLLEEMRIKYGDEVADGVEGLTQLHDENNKNLSKEMYKLHVFFSILGKLGTDPKLIEFKIYDKLHAAMTLDDIKAKGGESAEQRRDRTAQNIVNYYVPLAFKLNMHDEGLKMMRFATPHIQDEFEKAALQYAIRLYDTLNNKLNSKRDVIENFIKRMVNTIKIAVSPEIVDVNIPNPYEFYLLYLLHGEDFIKPYVSPRVVLQFDNVQQIFVFTAVLAQHREELDANYIESDDPSIVNAIVMETLPLENAISVGKYFIDGEDINILLTPKSERWRYTPLPELRLTNDKFEAFKKHFSLLYEESKRQPTMIHKIKAFLFGK